MTQRNESDPPTPTPRPHLTGNVPGIGGRIKEKVHDFEVEEIGAYPLRGDGPHYFLWVQKRGVDARSMQDAVARRYGVERRDIGTAGHKDRQAITRQWVSIPAKKGLPEPVQEELADGIEIVAVTRHGNKLRTGHLKGNRFSIRIRGASVQGEKLIESVETVAARLQKEGVPNYYGMQRFGDGFSTLHAGWEWVKGGDPPRDRFLRGMAASAIQSEVFNRVLARRLVENTWKTVLAGDIFEKLDSGGRFWIEESEREETQRRVDSGEIAITGPMPGSRTGVAEKEAGALESEILAGMGLQSDDFNSLGRRGRGTRRPLVVSVNDLTVSVEPPDEVLVRFSLPAGSYATVVLREFMEPA